MEKQNKEKQYYWIKSFPCGCLEYMEFEMDMIHTELCPKHQAKMDNLPKSERCSQCGKEYYPSITITKKGEIKIISAKQKIASHKNFKKYTVAYTFVEDKTL